MKLSPWSSSEDAAQQPPMSVCPWSIGNSANYKVSQGYPRLPKVTKGTRYII